MFGHHPMKFSETPEAGIKQCFIKAPFLWAVSLRMGVVLDTEHRQYRKCACFILSWGSNMTPAKEDPLLWQFDLRRSDCRCSPHLKTPIHNPGPTKGKQMPPTGRLQQSFFFKLRFFLQVVAARRSVFNWAIGTMDPIVFPKLFSSHKNYLSLIHNAMQVLEK